MQVVPLQAVPNQSLNVSLGSQPVALDILTKTTGLFCNVYVNSTLIIGGVLCLDQVLIVRDAYLGFTGDLAFYDTQGTSDPVYSGLGTRYVLLYYAPGDLT